MADHPISHLHYYKFKEISYSPLSYKNFDKSLKAIKERYNEIIKGLGLKLSLEEQFETIKKQFAAKAGKDYAVPAVNI